MIKPFKKQPAILLLAMLFLIQGMYVSAQPKVVSFSPKSGAAGSAVVITGNNFSTTPADNIVHFGMARANVIASTATSLTVTVPAQATWQALTVTVNGFIAYAPFAFKVLFNAPGAVFSPASFANRTDIATGSSASAGIIRPVVVADIDGDGKPDVVQFTASENLAVFRNISAGAVLAFSGANEFPVGPDPSGVNNISVGDVDGDGKPDLVMTAASLNPGGGRIFIMKNTSTSGVVSFAQKVSINAETDPFSVEVMDIDGDGKNDILVTYKAGGTMAVYRNTSIGNTLSFVAGAVAPGGYGVLTGDLDLDGKPDVVGIATNFGAPVTYVPIARNTSVAGSASFSNTVVYGTGLGSYPLSVADLDGDDKPELTIITIDTVLASTHAVRSSDTLITVFRNTGSPGNISFLKKDIAYHSGVGRTDIKIADLDGDGKPDLLSLSGDSVTILKNTSTTGNFTLDSLSRHSVKNSSAAQQLFTADFDGDGRIDVLTSFRTGGFTILRNIPASVVTAVNEGTNNNDRSINIFPNPAQDFIRVKYPDGYRNAELRILSLDGKKQQLTGAGYTASNTATIRVQHLAKGNYLLTLIKKGKPLVTKHFVKM